MSHNFISRAIGIIDRLASNKNVISAIAELQKELPHSTEQFVRKTLNELLNEDSDCEEFRSAWLFVIKKNAPSKAHYHPNSIQYTAIIDGPGLCEIGDAKYILQNFNPLNPDTLYVIAGGTPHEFFPGDKDLVVLSLHTAKPEELIEIDFASGKKELMNKPN